jgi:NAD-dependent DNA ligase
LTFLFARDETSEMVAGNYELSNQTNTTQHKPKEETMEQPKFTTPPICPFCQTELKQFRPLVAQGKDVFSLRCLNIECGQYVVMHIWDKNATDASNTHE